MLHEREWNTRLRLLFYGGPVYVAALAGLAAQIVRSPLITGVNQPVEQPLPFSHERHVGVQKLDCRYCHYSVEQNAFAGMPSVATCLGCHDHLWSGLAAVQTLKSSQQTRIPIEWLQVHDLPDFAYFDHSIHVAKGFGCVTCHGRVDRMPQVWQSKPLDMQWCLECHRNPQRYVQPTFTVASVDWQPPSTREDVHALAQQLQIEPLPESYEQLQQALIDQYRIHVRTSCSNCHQ